MKITPTDYTELSHELRKLDTSPKHFPKATDQAMANRWSAFWRLPQSLRTHLYTYLNDSNIDSALKKANKETP